MASPRCLGACSLGSIGNKEEDVLFHRRLRARRPHLADSRNADCVIHKPSQSSNRHSPPADCEIHLARYERPWRHRCCAQPAPGCATSPDWSLSPSLSTRLWADVSWADRFVPWQVHSLENQYPCTVWSALGSGTPPHRRFACRWSSLVACGSTP